MVPSALKEVPKATLLKWAGVLAGAICVALPAKFFVSVSRLERPTYTVSKTVRVGRLAAEVRDYEPYLIAESVVSGETMREGTTKGFMNVAGYIFGDNAGGRVSEDGEVEPAQVAMTAPVRTEQPQKATVSMTSPVRTELKSNFRNMKVSFVMPRKYKAGTLPKPKDGRVKIKSVGAHRMVAVRFRGPSPDEKKVAEVSRELFQALEGEGLTPKGGLLVYQYQPPFMPGFLRTNEVAVRV
ncbi:unnamed protein product [Ectocarpus sp. CCAP 1310/34]|nr:unnamed protein product [Ectocarpus sp. CCAP 1310/34]